MVFSSSNRLVDACLHGGSGNSHIEKQRRYFANKCPSSQGYGFSNGKYGCESWTMKKLSAKESMFLNCDVGENS